jgi:hypothetical protein
MAPLRRRPYWWEWPVELTPHVERRMGGSTGLLRNTQARRDGVACGGRMMLEITFHRGCPKAAYVYISKVGRKATATRKLAPSLVGDFDKRGALLGLEIPAFDRATISRINRVLVACGSPALAPKELAPLRAA